MIILVLGLPGAGKTSLANALAPRINGVVWNADDIRNNLHVDLGFSESDRVEHARRMGWAAQYLSSQGVNVIVDFVCPTPATRNAFGRADVTIWIDRISSSRFEDTNRVWEDPDPDYYDVVIPFGLTVEEEVDLTFHTVETLVDWRAPHALVLGRYQPWHEGHEWLYQQAEQRTGNVVVGVRTTTGLEKDPLTFDQVKSYMPKGRFVQRMPNITHVVYGRDVGYHVEQLTPPENIGNISATQVRKDLGLDLACASCTGGCEKDTPSMDVRVKTR
jgi:hypothetical protein